MNNVTAFRLTFNLPAQKFFFDGEDIEGIRIRIEDGRVSFKATNTTRGNDCVSFVTRARGGYEVPIDGEMADELLDVLMQEASVTRPFFMLKRTAKGWFEIEHYNSDATPPKFTPHMRVWFPREKMTNKGNNNSTQTPLNDEISGLFGDFVSVVRVAKRMVSDYEQTRKIGRPPREIVESREALLAFEQLSREILPELRANDDIEPLRQVADILNAFVRDRSPTQAKTLETKAEAKAEIKTPSKHRVDELDEPNFIMVDAPPVKRGRGRPKGSTNRKVDIVHTVPTTDLVISAA